MDWPQAQSWAQSKQGIEVSWVGWGAPCFPTFGSIASASREKDWKYPGTMAQAIPEMTIHRLCFVVLGSSELKENGGCMAGRQAREHLLPYPRAAASLPSPGSQGPQAAPGPLSSP